MGSKVRLLFPPATDQWLYNKHLQAKGAVQNLPSAADLEHMQRDYDQINEALADNRLRQTRLKVRAALMQIYD